MQEPTADLGAQPFGQRLVPAAFRVGDDLLFELGELAEDVENAIPPSR